MRSAKQRRIDREGWSMVAPTVLVVVVVVVIPVLWNVLIAFQDLGYLEIRETSVFRNLTLDNFREVFGAEGFWRTLLTTVIYSVAATVGSIALGLVAALALRRTFPGRGFVRAAMLLPYVAPVVAVAFVWQMMLNPQYGIVNSLGTRFLGWDAPIDFLGRSPHALITVIAFEIWRYFPFAFMFIVARLQAVPKDIEEAAIVDGATPLQSFRRVLLPQLLSVMGLLAVLRVIMTFNKFDDVYLLTGGAAGTEVAAVRVYDYLTGRFDAGGAAAQSLVLSAVMVGFLFLYMWFLKRQGANQ